MKDASRRVVRRGLGVIWPGRQASLFCRNVRQNARARAIEPSSGTFGTAQPPAPLAAGAWVRCHRPHSRSIPAPRERDKPAGHSGLQEPPSRFARCPSGAVRAGIVKSRAVIIDRGPSISRGLAIGAFADPAGWTGSSLSSLPSRGATRQSMEQPLMNSDDDGKDPELRVLCDHWAPGKKWPSRVRCSAWSVT